MTPKDKERVQCYVGAGEASKAVDALKKVCRKRPKDTEAWYMLGSIYGEEGFLDEAEPCIRTALKLNKKSGDKLMMASILRSLGSLLVNKFQYNEAANHYRDSLAIQPGQADVYLELGDCLAEMRCVNDSIEAYKCALEINPKLFAASRNLALLYEQLNRLEEARRFANSALKYDPGDIQSRYLLAKLDGRDGDLESAKRALSDLLLRTSSAEHKAMIYSELAAINDKNADYAGAFKMLAEAKKCYRALNHICTEDLENYRNEVSDYKNAFPFLHREKVIADDVSALKLVFLVGFPRSGTTLTEQILESHPDVIATHELPVLPRLTRDISKIIGRDFVYPKDIGGLSGEELAKLRSSYVASMEEGLHFRIDKDKFILDKLPLNVINIGFIARVFPDAKILLALRDPRDVCLSCYMQNFKINQAMSQFLSLEDTAKFYSAVMGLWLHYSDLLDIKFLSTRYEDVVEDLEGSARRLLDYLGLAWDERVLGYYESARSRNVFTPSYQAVTQPIYQSSKGKWKSYHQQMEPILPILEPFVDKFGYWVAS